MQWAKLYLTEQQVSDVENHTQGEFGSEEGEEPLGGVHVSLQVKLMEVGPQIRKLILWKQMEDKEEKLMRRNRIYENRRTRLCLSF